LNSKLNLKLIPTAIRIRTPVHKHARGLSKKTQMLYFTIFITRYLDLLDHKQRTYLVVFKLTYIISTGLTLVLFQ